MSLREQAAITLCDIEMGKIEDEFSRMWHNGSYCQSWPDVHDDEWDVFNASLEFFVDNEIEFLRERLEEEFNVDWEICQEGRTGATFYPKEFGNLVRRSEIEIHEVLTWDPEYELYDTDDPHADAYKQLKDIAEALKFFNNFVRESAKYIPEWWKEERERLVDNEYMEAA